MEPFRFDINTKEFKELQSLVDSCLDEFDSFDNVEFLKNLPLMAYQIPKRMAEFLNEFKYNPVDQGFCVVSTGMVEQEKIGPTPSHWELKTNNDTCQNAVMCMSLWLY